MAMSKTRTQLLALQQANGTNCHWCSRIMDANHPQLQPTRDHVHPKSKGGEEIVFACYACNHIKGDMTEDVWRAFMAANPDWWTSAPPPGRPRPRREPLPFSRSTRLLVSDDPLVRAVLDRFPGATITDIRQSAVDTASAPDSAPPNRSV